VRKTSLDSLLIQTGILLFAAAVFMALADPPGWMELIIWTALVVILLWRLHARIAPELGKLYRRAAEIAGGRHTLRLGDSTLKEVDDLSAEFNKVLDALDGAIRHLAVHREELRLVLGSIEDILWAQDYEGRLQWANQPFQKLFQGYNPNKVQLSREVIRDPELQAAIAKVEEQDSNLVPEIRFEGHSFILSMSSNEQMRRKVFILQNMDAIQQVFQMKRDFIVNLAHELRTPLTAIKGFTEAMRDNPDVDHTRYRNIILNHTQRLIHLVKDMEQLISLESSGKLDLLDIDLKKFFAGVRLLLEPDLQEKGLDLVIELDPSVPRIVCDPFRLEQVFINLAQNSLRYTDTGGIRISSRPEGDWIVFEVADSGCGIAKEHQNRIFERFFVADPARNKNGSGSGLGLAIVKHIVLLHQGEISVQSALGKGCTFTIKIPRLHGKD
jgi:two-component system phosphate regulon sensor histidine kinase PhoR